MSSDDLSGAGTADSAWRFALGRRICLAYAANPKARVVQVSGSTGRGTADAYSDLEIDVYWSAPPTDEERRAAVAAAGGALLRLYPYEEDEWAEELDFDGFHVGTSTFLVSTMERYLDEVLRDCSTEELPQMRLESLCTARTVAGDDLAARWRARAAAYPDGLVAAMLRANLRFDGLGYAEDVLAARDDLLLLYDVVVRVERQILGALLGLNRLYLPNPGFKRLDELVSRMTLVPERLAARLKGAFRDPPAEGLRGLHALAADVLDLVDANAPQVDTAPYRRRLLGRRGVWRSPPPGLGLGPGPGPGPGPGLEPD
jgi:hypothetical protein